MFHTPACDSSKLVKRRRVLIARASSFRSSASMRYIRALKSSHMSFNRLVNVVEESGGLGGEVILGIVAVAILELVSSVFVAGLAGSFKCSSTPPSDPPSPPSPLVGGSSSMEEGSSMSSMLAGWLRPLKEIATPTEDGTLQRREELRYFRPNQSLHFLRLGENDQPTQQTIKRATETPANQTNEQSEPVLASLEAPTG